MIEGIITFLFLSGTIYALGFIISERILYIGSGETKEEAVEDLNNKSSDHKDIQWRE